MEPKSIVANFVESLAEEWGARNSLLVKVPNGVAIESDVFEKVVEGSDWFESIDSSRSFSFVAVDAPLAMAKEKINIGGSSIKLRKNWGEIAKALRFLHEDGLCIAIVEPPAFGLAEGPKFLEALETEGFALQGVFDCPPNFLATTSIRPVIAAISRKSRGRVFAAELEDVAQASSVVRAFVDEDAGDSLGEGVMIEGGEFDGFDGLKARIQLDRLETQYKEYQSRSLGQVASEINTVRSGGSFISKENAVYVPMLGNSAVVDNLQEASIKHQNLFQVVFPDTVKNSYVAAFFRSDLGLLVLKSLTRGAVISRISKTELARAPLAVPGIQEQDEIVESHSKLFTLKAAIEGFQKDLALNPRSASAIRSQVESMLEKIGALTEADRIMGMAREGESATVEFKQTFSLDVSKGTKEKYIEVSALKTIVAFLNTKGGTLLVGVTDDGEILGINDEVKRFHKSNDGFLLHFKNRIKERIGEQNYPFIDQKIIHLGDAYVLMVECRQATSPCYLDEKEFYVRTNPATDKLEGPKLVEYIRNHFSS
ncbi:ATP-binding protein [Wenzhouxiangella sp. EGI_FJ10305]|uniref:ATP-binding protein n=1 Tax=Wenzhouxiangella sp. EGI_FJ10305 TaxID=3243768 RepID=UPI0035DA256E